MAAVGLILGASTKPIPSGPGELARRCRDEVVNVWRCLTVVAEDESTYLAVVVKRVSPDSSSSTAISARPFTVGTQSLLPNARAYACFEQCCDWTRKAGSQCVTAVTQEFTEVDDY